MKADWVIVSIAGLFVLLALSEQTPTSSSRAALPPSAVSIAPKVDTTTPPSAFSRPKANISSDRYASRSFNGYPCTLDCSGHEAGYQWGEENGIEDPDDCDGNSESFIEGCRSYAEENSLQDDSETEE